MIPHLQNLIIQQGIEDSRFYIDETDLQTIRFIYPQIYTDQALIQEIRLEIGSLVAWTPLTTRKVTPFVSEQFPDLFDKVSTKIRTVEAKRTFWEKATILHSEAHRVGTKIPQRYSRHYYDLYMLYKSHVKDEAFADFELLKKVAIFKQKFYRSNRAKYDEANKDGLQLVPSKESIIDLQNDYNSMQSMIFGEPIPIEE